MQSTTHLAAENPPFRAPLSGAAHRRPHPTFRAAPPGGRKAPRAPMAPFTTRPKSASAPGLETTKPESGGRRGRGRPRPLETVPSTLAYMAGGTLAAGVVPRLLPTGAGALTTWLASAAAPLRPMPSRGRALGLSRGEDWRPTIESLHHRCPFGAYQSQGASDQVKSRSSV